MVEIRLLAGILNVLGAFDVAGVDGELIHMTRNRHSIPVAAVAATKRIAALPVCRAQEPLCCNMHSGPSKRI